MADKGKRLYNRGRPQRRLYKRNSCEHANILDQMRIDLITLQRQEPMPLYISLEVDRAISIILDTRRYLLEKAGKEVDEPRNDNTEPTYDISGGEYEGPYPIPE